MTMSSESDQSFREKVEEIKEQRESGEYDGPDKEIPRQVRWGAVVGAFLGGGLVGAIANPTQPVFTFLIIGLGAGGIAWAFATESGKQLREEIEKQQQQQQSSDNTEPKVVCSECGWQNPRKNNYCHDCGEDLNK